DGHHAPPVARELDVVVVAPLRAASRVARERPDVRPTKPSPGPGGGFRVSAPRFRRPARRRREPMVTDRYLTRGGVAVRRTIEDVPVRNAIEPIVSALDERRGALLASSYEYPGRYTRWDLGFVDPPVALTARGRRFRAEALNPRGRVLLPALARVLSTLDAVATLETRDDG